MSINNDTTQRDECKCTSIKAAPSASASVRKSLYGECRHHPELMWMPGMSQKNVLWMQASFTPRTRGNKRSVACRLHGCRHFKRTSAECQHIECSTHLPPCGRCGKRTFGQCRHATIPPSLRSVAWRLHSISANILQKMRVTEDILRPLCSFNSYVETYQKIPKSKIASANFLAEANSIRPYELLS